jgi:hypothetical protein
MNPSNWFRTGGALIDPQRLGCTGFIVRWGLALSGLIVLIMFYAFT